MLFNSIEKNADATILLHKVKDPTRFGIINMDRNSKVLSIIEKPNLEISKKYLTHQGYLAIAGLIILKKNIFHFIDETESGLNDEFWLTDSIKLLNESGCNMFGVLHQGDRYDIGTFEDLRKPMY